MPIRLFNSLTKTKEDFAPIDAKNVRMYVCGPTVYDFAHIGNARPAIVFDVLYRLLRHEYGANHVTYARNFTDVDDKINARAAEHAKAHGISVDQARAELTATTERQYLEDVRALGCLDPDEMPRATEHIGGMIAMISELIARGLAYEAQGHVLFDVAKKADYGKLARRSLDDMIAGARVDVAPYKKGPMDFVLWKPSDAGTPGWDSPWGRGRPGWHIECSAMIKDRLGPGDTIDIHGGGIDLVFPHHENEIAQSEGAHHGHVLANVWMHNGFLQVEGEKMSKSLGNFVTIREILSAWRGCAWSGSAARLAMLRTHYRQPIDWTLDALIDAREELATWALLARAGDLNSKKSWGMAPKPSNDFLDALSDDLNTPEALRILRSDSSAALAGDDSAAERVTANARFLGVINTPNVGVFISGVSGVGGVGIETLRETVNLGRSFQAASANNDVSALENTRAEFLKLNLRPEISSTGLRLYSLAPQAEVKGQTVERLVAARNAARARKDFKESDRIRDELLAQGIVLKDGPQGTTWEVKK